MALLPSRGPSEKTGGRQSEQRARLSWKPTHTSASTSVDGPQAGAARSCKETGRTLQPAGHVPTGARLLLLCRKGWQMLGRQPLPHGPAWDTSSSRLCCSRRPQLAVLCRAHESTTSTALPLIGQVRAGIQPTAPNLQVRFTPKKSYPKSALCKTLPKLSSSRTSLTRRLAHRLVPAGSGWAPASPSRTIL